MSRDTSTETDWAEEIGKPASEGVAKLVAALECDYDRLTELRDDRDGWEPAEGGPATWAESFPDDAEELKELEAEAGECSSLEDAEQRIMEDPLSVEVRSDWCSPGEPFEAGEYRILLATGGPAVRIVGDLGAHGEPSSARLEVQDWFKPWTEYVPAPSSVLLTYARCFLFQG